MLVLLLPLWIIIHKQATASIHIWHIIDLYRQGRILFRSSCFRKKWRVMICNLVSTGKKTRLKSVWFFKYYFSNILFRLLNNLGDETKVSEFIIQNQTLYTLLKKSYHPCWNISLILILLGGNILLYYDDMITIYFTNNDKGLTGKYQGIVRAA